MYTAFVYIYVYLCQPARDNVLLSCVFGDYTLMMVAW